MKSTEISFQEWLQLKPSEQQSLSASWNKSKGDGKNIIEQANNLLKEQFASHGNIHVSFALYHGDEWAIIVKLKVGEEAAIPDTFHGIRVVKLYEDISDSLKAKLQTQYGNNIERFVESELGILGKYFTFTDSPHAKKWLVDFVKKYAA